MVIVEAGILNEIMIRIYANIKFNDFIMIHITYI